MIASSAARIDSLARCSSTRTFASLIFRIAATSAASISCWVRISSTARCPACDCKKDCDCDKAGNGADGGQEAGGQGNDSANTDPGVDHPLYRHVRRLRLAPQGRVFDWRFFRRLISVRFYLLVVFRGRGQVLFDLLQSLIRCRGPGVRFRQLSLCIATLCVDTIKCLVVFPNFAFVLVRGLIVFFCDLFAPFVELRQSMFRLLPTTAGLPGDGLRVLIGVAGVVHDPALVTALKLVGPIGKRLCPCAKLLNRRRRCSAGMGVEDKVEVDYRSVPMAVGDVYLLTTDGVHEFIDGRDLTNVIAAESSLDAARRRAVHPDPLRRYDALSEFVSDLKAPGAGWNASC